MPKDIDAAVREICLSFPKTEEFTSHGSPNFRVRAGKIFATYAVNHHGDGRVALWLNSPPGVQGQCVKESPKYFFVPPYVGPRGWLGVLLDKGLSWRRVAQLVRQAYENTAPLELRSGIGKTVVITPPSAKMSAERFDPMQSKRAQAVLKVLRKICLALPEVSEGTQFGAPVWRAGKKVFAMAYAYENRLRIAFWVGIDRQGLMTMDKRYEVPAYMGHNGWIALDVGKSCNLNEVRDLALFSYRHFALKRMLKTMDERVERNDAR
jgi:predicted DNA-binding protein (MmcQ/YjbR family)